MKPHQIPPTLETRFKNSISSIENRALFFIPVPRCLDNIFAGHFWVLVPHVFAGQKTCRLFSTCHSGPHWSKATVCIVTVACLDALPHPLRAQLVKSWCCGGRLSPPSHAQELVLWRFSSSHSLPRPHSRPSHSVLPALRLTTLLLGSSVARHQG